MYILVEILRKKMTLGMRGLKINGTYLTQIIRRISNKKKGKISMDGGTRRHH